MNSLTSIILTIINSYGVYIIYLLTIIIGLALAKRTANDDATKKLLGVSIPIVAAFMEFFIPRLAFLDKSVGKKAMTNYIVVCMVLYILRFVAVAISLKLFADYSPARWIISLYAVLAALYLLRTIFYSRVVYNVAAFINDKSMGGTFLKVFMNNPSALNVINLLCTFIPFIMIFLDSLSSVRKK